MKHKELIEKIKTIEETILKKYNVKKTPFLKIYEQIRYGFIKIFNDIGNQPHYNLVLKISGIWETETNYGLTYKFC